MKEYDILNTLFYYSCSCGSTKLTLEAAEDNKFTKHLPTCSIFI